MADLKSLFAKGKDSNAAPTPAVVDGPDKSGQVPSASEAAPAKTPQPANPFAARVSNGGGDSGEQRAGSDTTGGGNAGGGGEPKSGLGSLRINTRPSDSSVDTGGVASAPIDSLESLDATEDAGIESGPSVTYFADETPADKPTRELPEGLSKEQLGFIDTLDSVYEIIHDPELLGGVIRNIMVELKSYPEYIKLIAPEDVRVMVRGMRESMGLARVKKQETKSKRGGGKKGSKALDADMLADLDSLGLST